MRIGVRQVAFNVAPLPIEDAVLLRLVHPDLAVAEFGIGGAAERVDFGLHGLPLWNIDVVAGQQLHTQMLGDSLLTVQRDSEPTR